MTIPLKISGLRVHIPIGDETVCAIDGIDIELGEREILAIVGESGSGKSMTARSILRLLPPHAHSFGAVVLEGRDVMTADAAALRKIRGSSAAMVFQEPSTALNPVYKVGWQIGEGLRAHGVRDPKERRRRAIEMLKAVGIPDPETRIDYYPHQFSGGQKQRVVIAMALALGPSVIIADEPTTALDVTVQAEILDLLRRCRDELNASIIIITHNMGVVADLADRVAVMYKGKIVEEASVETLFASPKDEYTKHLLSSVPHLGKGGKEAEAPVPEDVEASPILRVRDLEITYGGGLGIKRFKAVEGVSFEIAPGEVLGLVGESGSGKSTIGRSLVGLAPVTGGSISFFGTEVNGASSKTLRTLRRRVGFVFQDPASSFNPHMTISDCISEPIRVHRFVKGESEIQKRVAKLLDYVQLSRDFASRHPFELSGGQRQRVGLARALALDPEFVIADEPTSALDVSVQARVLEIFKELQAELGFATLFISHDLGVVEQVADRVGVLKGGNLLEIGRTRQVLLDPHHEYTRTLISAVPIPDPIRQREQRLKRQLIAPARE